MKEQSQLDALYQVDCESTKAMQALVTMLESAFDLGLLPELLNARDALSALHAAATVKYNALTGKVLN